MSWVMASLSISLEPLVLFNHLAKTWTVREELHEFERLEVWELVPLPDKAFIITLKWIYKVKLDELGGILKNKAQLGRSWLSSEEGIDFESHSLRLQD
ncbi:hypothetical protein Tco_0389297 [Tanacetum coccineum]